MLISTGGIGSSGKGHAFFREMGRRYLSIGQALELAPYLSLRLISGRPARADEGTTAL